MPDVEPLPYTLLPLATYARVMGINPVTFAGATAVTVFPVTNSCTDIWPRHTWQHADIVSREELAYEIANVEHEIAQVAGYYPAPNWIVKESHPWPKYHRNDNLYSLSYGYKTKQLDHGKLIRQGRRAVTLIDDDVAVAYSDPDGDGFLELATVTVAGTTLTQADAQKVGVYFIDEDGAQEWQVRPLKNVTVTAGTLVITLDSWLLIDPDVDGAYPTDTGYSATNISTITNFVRTVDVYTEDVSTTEYSTVFYWEPLDVGTTDFELQTQNGGFTINDPDIGLITPAPATLSAGDYTVAAWSQCIEPSRFEVWYQAGDRSRQYVNGTALEPMSNWWAQIIAWMATARLERPACSCGNLTALTTWLQEDLSRIGSETSYQGRDDVLNCPFGTRRGEVKAWEKIRRVSEQIIQGVAL